MTDIEWMRERVEDLDVPVEVPMEFVPRAALNALLDLAEAAGGLTSEWDAEKGRWVLLMSTKESMNLPELYETLTATIAELRGE